VIAPGRSTFRLARIDPAFPASPGISDMFAAMTGLDPTQIAPRAVTLVERQRNAVAW
jgi:hypothetical protein